MIVDEVFDANGMDLMLVELAALADLDVTIVGDPWQAVHDFRGARSSLIKPFVEHLGLIELPLTQSFRWVTDTQAALAAKLRAGVGVNLAEAADLRDVDVVLATEWGPLWDLGASVLPLACGSQTSTPEEAAATLLLKRMTGITFGLPGTFINDALIALRLPEGTPAQLETQLDEILAILQSTAEEAANEAWDRLVTLLDDISPRPLRKRHWRYVKRMKQLAERRRQVVGGLVPAITAHQAKGGEWPGRWCVPVQDREAHLAKGLDQDVEDDRKVYVASTRAQRATHRLTVLTAPLNPKTAGKSRARSRPGLSHTK